MVVTAEMESADRILGDPDFGAVSAAYAATGTARQREGGWAVSGDTYRTLYDGGLIQGFALRADGRLVGLASLLLGRSLHTSKDLALVESLFVLEDYRAYSFRLISAMVRYAREKGIRAISIGAHEGSRLDRIMRVQVKRGCAEHEYNSYLVEVGRNGFDA